MTDKKTKIEKTKDYIHCTKYINIIAHDTCINLQMKCLLLQLNSINITLENFTIRSSSRTQLVKLYKSVIEYKKGLKKTNKPVLWFKKKQDCNKAAVWQPGRS